MLKNYNTGRKNMKNKKLETFLNNLDKGMYKSCYIKIKLDKKGFIVKLSIEKDIEVEEPQ